MPLKTLLQKIYILVDDPELSKSIRALLEMHGTQVITIENVENFTRTVPIGPSDTILIDQRTNRPKGFKLLHTLMFQNDHPAIILITDAMSPLNQDDLFLGQNVRILPHPVSPQQLISAISHLT